MDGQYPVSITVTGRGVCQALIHEKTRIYLKPLTSQWVIPYLHGLGYEKLQTEVLIATSGGTVRADVVAYSSETGQPQVVVQ